jgi:hypothetical protein
MHAVVVGLKMLSTAINMERVILYWEIREKISGEGNILDFVGFFGIDGGEFSWMVLTPILVKYA